MPPSPPNPIVTQGVSLWSLLHPGLGRWQEDRLTTQQRKNLLQAVATLEQPRAQHSGGPHSLATIQVDRNPEKKYGSGWVRTDGRVATLRTGNEWVWLYSLDPQKPLSRVLHPVERLSVQGFRPEMAEGLSKQELLQATGNSFCVPVVAAVLGQLLWSLAGQAWGNPRMCLSNLAEQPTLRRSNRSRSPTRESEVTRLTREVLAFTERAAHLSVLRLRG